MSKLRKILIILLTLIFALGMFACTDTTGGGGGGDDGSGGDDDGTTNPPPEPPKDLYAAVDYTSEHMSDDYMVSFYSSVEGLGEFLNEYRERHMRYNPDTRVHYHPVGKSESAWKEWDSMIASWWDASTEYGTFSTSGNDNYATKDLLDNWLRTCVQDRQGYIWADNGAALRSWGLGWEFPNSYDGKSSGWYADFATAGNFEGFTVSGGTATVNASLLTVSALQAPQISIESGTVSIAPLWSPFLKINFSLIPGANCNVKDLYLYWQREGDTGYSEEQKVSFKDFCTTGTTLGNKRIESQGFFFPMYLHEKWGWDEGKKITKLKLVFAADSNTLTGNFALDYVATDYDDRQANNVCNYIIAAKNMCAYSQSTELLSAVLPKARKAMNFLYHQLEGSTGLISTEYLCGHDNQGTNTPGYGMGDGYWDVLAFPDVNLYCNISYYNALVAMTFLEQMAAHTNTSVAAVSTLNSDMSGNLPYTLTAESLATLAQTCKSKIRTEFWNEKTQRFHAGVRSDGVVQDRGYLMFNEQLIAAGVPTEEQTKLVMQWINGEREVKSDNSRGEDIYYYGFAPRFNTRAIGTDFYWDFSSSWNGNIQNGGTGLHLAYYDMAAQAKVSPDKAYEKLAVLQKFFEDAKEAYEKSGLDDPAQFYRPYFLDRLMLVQGGGTSGNIGVDNEFLEAVIVLCAMPDVFFGMQPKYDNTLVIEPLFLSEPDWLRVENITYGGYYCDVAASRLFVELSEVYSMDNDSAVAGAKVELRLSEPDFDYKVLINGEISNDYTVVDGKVVVKADFDDIRLEIRKA